MMLGPPPSAAGPSHNDASASSAPSHASSTAQSAPTASTSHPSSSATATGSSVPLGHYANQFPVQQPPSHQYYGAASSTAHPVALQPSITTQQTATTTSYPRQSTYYSNQPPTSGTSQPQPAAGAYSYYGYPPNAWSNAWNAGSFQYPSGGYPYSYTAPQPSAPPAAPQPDQSASMPPPKQKTPSPTPSYMPSKEYCKDWDAAIKSFLSAIGFSQALKGFEADMVVLNPEWERKKVPNALHDLATNLSKLTVGKEEVEEPIITERSLEDRKLDNVRFANGTPRSHTSITGDISRFLARNRTRNDASNRDEFLLTLAEKRRRLNENGDAESPSAIPSCARTDAKTQNRDIQMKYDIVKNEDGPLRRTIQPPSSMAINTTNAVKTSQDYPSAERFPALDERLQNIEKHFSVRYVPSAPKSLLDRLKFLEDHIVHLEREYPPWAALHFNQPNRGWPPPPRATPIIVPSHLTSTAPSGVVQPTEAGLQVSVAEAMEGSVAKGKGKARHTKSSLHRAVMEKLEVQKAIHDLAGAGKE